MQTVPTFVVVGYVNRGKSSVISTLAADDSVEISSTPGTTQHNAVFELRAQGETLIRFIDTPGFERPRDVYHWLKAHETDPGSRRQVVEAFVKEHRGIGMFKQECELLEPILQGAAILYVVDGSKPPMTSASAEMEILQWTGQPRMALINPTRQPQDETTEQQWRAQLDQFFHLIRTFNAHAADYPRRLALLRSLREVDQQAAAALDRAIEALQESRAQQRDAAAAIIADTLTQMLQLTKEKKLAADADVDAHRQPLKEQYLAALRDAESRCRDRILDVYGHHELTVEQAVAGEDLLTDDLFSKSTWTQLGLSRNQLISAGVAAGAAAGGMVDLSVGGASFLAGSLIGGILGGAGVWYGSNQLAQTKILGQPMAGKLLRIGPVSDPQFPWIILDRAVLFHRRIANRAHAARGLLHLDATDLENVSRNMGRGTRSEFNHCFKDLRKSRATEKNQRELRELIAAQLADE